MVQLSAHDLFLLPLKILPLAPYDRASLVKFKSSERSPPCGESSRLRLWNNNFVSQDKPSSLPFKVFHWHTQHLSLVQQFDTFNFAPPFLDEDLWFGKSHGQIKMDDAWNQMEFFPTSKRVIDVSLLSPAEGCSPELKLYSLNSWKLVLRIFKKNYSRFWH